MVNYCSNILTLLIRISVNGLNIVDSIANAATNNLDRPLTDIRIKSVKILEQ